MAAKHKSCSVHDCNRNSLAANGGSGGLCSAHYQRSRRYGDPLGGKLPLRQKYGSTCKVAGCQLSALRQDHGRNGYCTSHYQRLHRHGDHTKGLTVRGEAWRFAIELTREVQHESCITWPYTRDQKGYGRLRREGRGKAELAHRVICGMAHGNPPSVKHQAAHSCGGGHLGCVNPRHLRWATSQENHDDMRAHGTVLEGERAPRSKLTEGQVREIRALIGTISKYALAKRFGVTDNAITAIERRITWKSV